VSINTVARFAGDWRLDGVEGNRAGSEALRLLIIRPARSHILRVLDRGAAKSIRRRTIHLPRSLLSRAASFR